MGEEKEEERRREEGRGEDKEVERRRECKKHKNEERKDKTLDEVRCLTKGTRKQDKKRTDNTSQGIN